MGKSKSWRHEIDFQCRFGLWPFQKTLSISHKGFEWCGELIPLKDIERLRWGTELKRGGIMPKRVYAAVFGTKSREYEIKTRQKDFYEHLVERYWKASGIRLLAKMLDGLGGGETYEFGKLRLSDCGIALREKKLLGGVRTSFYEWKELAWGAVNGSLSFVSREKPDRLLFGLSFLWVDNTHVLYAALKLLEQSPDKTRLSKAAKFS